MRTSEKVSQCRNLEHILFYFLGGFTEILALTTTPADTLINGGNQLVLINEK